ncbi:MULTISPECIES: flagellar protein FlgN [Paenibacillus]|uniref:flagellar protein FlgN n=1 Tax=Paenibacillus TaxID=44249 RepID=UPI000366FA9A|nr:MULTISPECIES: flagellar protein FlgN [Paenibacillus]
MSLDNLVDVLNKLDVYHQQMIELGESKKNSIVANDIDVMIRVMNQESKLIKLIEQTEQERMQASYDFLKERGIKSQLNLTLTELARLVFDVEDKKRLLGVQSKLKSTLDRLKELNDLNQQLIQQSLDFIEFSLDVIVDKPEQDMVYQHPAAAQYGAGQRRGLFDTRG